MVALPDAVAGDTWVRAATAARTLRVHASQIIAVEDCAASKERRDPAC